jgi:4-hydroxybenzoyl-CoA thioesterase/acyl-CoA thioester hydrolase
MSRIERIKVEDLHPAVWRTPVRIRFGQCDPAGIVYTPNYFDIFNGVVEDWYPARLGLDYHAILRDDRVGVGYGHASADFLIPGFMGETLDVAVVLGKIGRASFNLTLHAMKGADEAVRGRLVVVCTCLDERKAIPIPPRLRAALEEYQRSTA